MIDYMNPREELPKFDKYVDEIPAFDRSGVSLLRPYDELARQQVNMVIRGRSNYALEEGKYDITMDNQSARANAVKDQLRPPRVTPSTGDPPPTPSMQR